MEIKSSFKMLSNVIGARSLKYAISRSMAIYSTPKKEICEAKREKQWYPGPTPSFTGYGKARYGFLWLISMFSHPLCDIFEAQLQKMISGLEEAVAIEARQLLADLT